MSEIFREESLVKFSKESPEEWSVFTECLNGYLMVGDFRKKPPAESVEVFPYQSLVEYLKEFLVKALNQSLDEALNGFLYEYLGISLEEPLKKILEKSLDEFWWNSCINSMKNNKYWIVIYCKNGTV